MILAAAAVLALQAAARPPCTAEDVRTASVPPQHAWIPVTFGRDVPADQRRWISVAFGADLGLLESPDFGFVALPLSPFDFAFFAVRGERMTLHLCRGATCQNAHDGPKREIAWLGTYTGNMPDLAFDRSEVHVFDRGRYRRVCRVTFETP